MSKAPFEMLQGLLAPGRVVRVKVGRRRGELAVVQERLTPREDPSFVTGAARYAVVTCDGTTADYRRHELAKASRRSL